MSLHRKLIVAGGLIAALTVPTSAIAKPPALSRAALHRAAEQAVIVRDLLQIEQTLAGYVQPKTRADRALVRKLESLNDRAIALVSAIIRDERRVAAIRPRERHGADASAASAPSSVDAVLSDATVRLEQLKALAPELKVADGVKLQELLHRWQLALAIQAETVKQMNAAMTRIIENMR